MILRMAMGDAPAPDPAPTPTRTRASGEDIAEARRTLSGAYSGVAWQADETASPFSYRYASTGDPTMTLRAVQFEGHLEGVMPAGDDFVMQWITKGTGVLDLGRDAIRLQVGQPRLWPSSSFEFTFEDYEQQLVQLNRASVAKVAAERGIAAHQLRLDHRSVPTPAALRLWRDSLQLISRTVLDAHASPLMQAEMGRLGSLALLELYPQTAVPLPAPLLLPGNAALRTAVEHAHEHAHLPLTSADLAAAARVPVRTLQAAFQKHLGVTPNAYLRSVRLERVREELLAGHPETTTVGDVAQHWGFAHAGRFSAAYAEHFGEYPRDTLQRRA
jgi:AraC-like DNA-binding protein